MAVIQNPDGSIRILEENETLTRGKEKEKILVVTPRAAPLPDWKTDLAEFRKQLEKK